MVLGEWAEERARGKEQEMALLREQQREQQREQRLELMPWVLLREEL